MILVIGATGNVGRELVVQLRDTGAPVRAMARNPVGLPQDVEAVRGDLSAPDSLIAGLAGVKSVFLVWPSLHSDVAPSILDVVAGHAQRIVFLSSGAIHDGVEKQAGPIAQVHADVEQHIAMSGLDWTFLRPHGFAANIRVWVPQISRGDVVRGAYGSAAMTLIHEQDIAAVAARALLDGGHSGATYELTGPELLTQRAQVRILGEAIGRPLHWEEISVEAAREEMLAWLPPSYADAVLDARADAVTNPRMPTRTVEEITGVPASAFRDWVTDHAGEFR